MRKLRTLIARENPIGMEGLVALARNESIEHLDISKTNLKGCLGHKPYIARRNAYPVHTWSLPAYSPVFNESLMGEFIERNTTLESLEISHWAYNRALA